MAPTLTYGAAFVTALALARMLTPAAQAIAQRYGLVDHPGGHKLQPAPVPLLGGVAVAVACLGTTAVVGALAPVGVEVAAVAAVLAAAVLVFVVGLADDLRGLSPLTRLLPEAGVAVALALGGYGVEWVAGEGLNMAVTVLWLVGITNAFNLLDNMDGLAAGVAAIAAAAFFAIAAATGQILVAVLALAVAGAAIGFLPSNAHPARIYLGDAGSLLIGFLLAVIGARLQVDGAGAVPVVVLGVPIFDTLLVSGARLCRGCSPFKGGRDHSSHRLERRGLSVRAAVATLYSAGVALAALALVLVRVANAAVMLLALVIVGLVVTARPRTHPTAALADSPYQSAP